MTSPLANDPGRQHNAAMPRDALTDAVARAIEHAPVTIRELAREAGVPDSTLVRIVSGERRATAAVAEEVARALERWSNGCERDARRIREAQRRREP
jgi:plasmid maintenance system antidote protein VapI